MIAGDPASLALLAEGEYANAALTALARAIGFIPLVFTTAIVTGVYGAARMYLCICGRTFPSWKSGICFLAGVVIMVVSCLIDLFAKGMDRFPGVKDMGEYVRTSMNKVLEVALLSGGIVRLKRCPCPHPVMPESAPCL